MAVFPVIFICMLCSPLWTLGENVTSDPKLQKSTLPDINLGTTSSTKPTPDLSHVAEGGTVLLTNKPNPTINGTQNNTETHMGREHVIDSTPSNRNISEIYNTPNATRSPSSELPQTSSQPVPKPLEEKLIPVSDDSQEKNDNKTSVPKKGVIDPLLNDTTNMTMNATTETPALSKKKPLVTEDVGDEVQIPLSDKTTKQDIPSIENIDEENKTKRQADYVVPIVAVILSVPLVAIVISVLYKRGAEWWQHRHYRRMDFLIEGMYNN